MQKGTRFKAEIDCQVVGPCFHWKTKRLIGYHVTIKFGRERALVKTMIPIDQIVDWPQIQDDTYDLIYTLCGLFIYFDMTELAPHIELFPNI